MPDVMGFASPEVGLDIPLRSLKELIIVTKLVTVFDNTADLDVWHGKDLCHDLDALPFLDEFVVRFSCEGDHCPIRVDGSALDIVDGKSASIAAASKAEFDVAVLLAQLSEYLETDVDAEHVEFVVGSLFAVEID